MAKRIKGCAIGEREIVRIFKIFSFETISVVDVKNFNEELKRELESENYEILIITETYIASINDENKALINEKKPIIMSIPINTGSKELAISTLSAMIRKAVGVDLISIGGENKSE
jgi:vacuolar-type H+-ATPase subunit F/Vma7